MSIIRIAAELHEETAAAMFAADAVAERSPAPMAIVLETTEFDELREAAESGWDFYYRPLETGP